MARDQRVVAEVHIGTNPQRFQPYPMAWKAWLHKYIVGTLQPMFGCSSPHSAKLAHSK